MEWQDKEFTALTVDELQRIYWLRAQVFNAEQQSSYPEPDEQDRHCHHLFAREGEQVVAYARYFATADGVSFGRVVVAKAYRGKPSRSTPKPQSWVIISRRALKSWVSPLWRPNGNT